MENQPINGYRQLSQVETDLINEIKAKGVELGALVEKLFDHTRQQIDSANAHGASTGDFTEFQRLTDAEPHHWVATGATNLQQGLMALTRAVAQPTIF
ncbi:hypothetical protein D7V21_16595 [Acinetobacter guerrae]|uniref:Acb2/Tad1 hairpin domain-containing protein n=1 Tax=Acinetobacter guerrae TaxID=1843371 RepID=A0A3A8E907_9GAMM|nr:hypothetical protein [Acinetobacter guerrae]RKG30056.1 hypothetical protein D7V21_16595 [Acinetobacter guerrae]